MDNKKVVALLVYSLLSTALNVLGGTGVVPPISGSSPAPCPPAASAHP